MPPVVAAAIISAAGVFGAAEVSSSGNQSAASTTAGAAEQAANLQSQTAAAQLAYTEKQAALTQQNYAATQAANYGQYATRQNNLSTLSELAGVGPRQVAPYVPTVDPTGASVAPPPTAPLQTGGPGSPVTPQGTPAPTAPTAPGNTPTAAPTAAPSPSASANPLDPSAITAALQSTYQALGVTPTGPGTGPTDISYFATQIANTGGLTPQNAAYWLGPTGRVAQSLNQSGAPSTSSPAGAPGTTNPAASPYASTLASMAPAPLPQAAPPVINQSPWQFPAQVSNLGALNYGA